MDNKCPEIDVPPPFPAWLMRLDPFLAKWEENGIYTAFYQLRLRTRRSVRWRLRFLELLSSGGLNLFLGILGLALLNLILDLAGPKGLLAIPAIAIVAAAISAIGSSLKDSCTKLPFYFEQMIFPRPYSENMLNPILLTPTNSKEMGEAILLERTERIWRGVLLNYICFTAGLFFVSFFLGDTLFTGNATRRSNFRWLHWAISEGAIAMVFFRLAPQGFMEAMARHRHETSFLDSLRLGHGFIDDFQRKIRSHIGTWYFRPSIYTMGVILLGFFLGMLKIWLFWTCDFVLGAYGLSSRSLLRPELSDLLTTGIIVSLCVFFIALMRKVFATNLPNLQLATTISAALYESAVQSRLSKEPEQ